MKIKAKIVALIASFALFLGLPFSFNNREVEVKAETTNKTFTPTYSGKSYAVFLNKGEKGFSGICKPGTTTAITSSIYYNVTSVTVTNNLDATALNDLRTNAGSNIYEFGEVAYDVNGNPVTTDGCNIPVYFVKNDTDSTYECTIYAPVDKIYANQNSKHLFSDLQKCKNINFVNFDTSNVTDMSYMFSNLEVLESLDISSFDGSNVEDMSYMFSGVSSIKNLTLPAQNFAPKAKSASRMFQSFNFKGNLTSWDFLKNLNTTSVEDMSWMFSKAYAKDTEKLDFTKFPNFKTSSVTTMRGMFQDAQGIKSIDVSSFDTSNVKDMSEMFNQCGLTEIDLSNFKTQNVTSMSSMFEASPSLKSVTFANNWGPICTNMMKMFNNCRVIESLDLSTFEIKEVIYMNYMFGSCASMKTVTLPADMDTTKVTNMSNMFYYCMSLERVDISQLDIGASTRVSSMFSGCQSLTYVHAPINTLPEGVSITLPDQFNTYANIAALDSSIESSRIIDILVEYFRNHWVSLRTEGSESGMCATLVGESTASQEYNDLLDIYNNKATDEQRNAIASTPDGNDGTTIGDTMQYLQNVKDGNQTTEGDYGVTTPTQTGMLSFSKSVDSNVSLIVLISVLSVIAISGYYIISKRKHA